MCLSFFYVPVLSAILIKKTSLNQKFYVPCWPWWMLHDCSLIEPIWSGLPCSSCGKQPYQFSWQSVSVVLCFFWSCAYINKNLRYELYVRRGEPKGNSLVSSPQLESTFPVSRLHNYPWRMFAENVRVAWYVHLASSIFDTSLSEISIACLPPYRERSTVENLTVFLRRLDQDWVEHGHGMSSPN